MRILIHDHILDFEYKKKIKQAVTTEKGDEEINQYTNYRARDHLIGDDEDIFDSANYVVHDNEPEIQYISTIFARKNPE